EHARGDGHGLSRSGPGPRTGAVTLCGREPPASRTGPDRFHGPGFAWAARGAWSGLLGRSAPLPVRPGLGAPDATCGVPAAARGVLRTLRPTRSRAGRSGSVRRTA